MTGGTHAPHGLDTPGAGASALARALDRWRRLATPAPPAAPEGIPRPGRQEAGGDDPASGLAGLARRLDDGGCAYGRVSAARLDDLSRGYERLETKLNAVLMAVTGTFLSTLAGLLLYLVRGGSH